MIPAKAIESAVQHHRAGRIQEAEQIYREVLAADPRNFDALHLLGVIAHDAGNHRQAVELIERALEIDPSCPPAHRNLGEAYRALGMLDRAQASHERAVALDPGSADAHNCLGITLAANLQFDAAMACYERAIACQPDFVEAHCNLGNALRDLSRFDEAIASYERALAIIPDFAQAHIMLGYALEQAGRTADALAEYQQGLAIDPRLADGQLYLGRILQRQGMVRDALECFETALEIAPDYVEARWFLAMSQLALVHEADAAAKTNREEFSKAIADLDAWFDASRIAKGANAVGVQQPFFLAYHESNNRELLSRYGDLCSRLMQHWQASEGIMESASAAGAKIRVGLVSGQIRDHSVWRAILKGWLQHVDRERFTFHVFHTGTVQDEETAFARSCATDFVQAPRKFREWIDEIIGHHLDILIYPELGMDPLALKLASMRLAPVQAVAWGHPETSGLPTVDYYISAQDFEPEGAQDNYREKLVALPHLGCCYEPLQVKQIDLDLSELGIDTDSPILICPGVPFKYAPQNDWILVEIAKRLGKCQLVFFHYMRENLSDTLEQRLEAAFDDAGLFFHGYGIFLPWLSRAAFYALMRRADVFLDTIGFSGFNTAMQAIECGLPVVAKDGLFMRGRLGSGILKRAGLPELVAKSAGEYVDLAVRLASDKAFAAETRRRIEANRDVLFNDLAPIRALEKFLDDAVRRPAMS